MVVEEEVGETRFLSCGGSVLSHASSAASLLFLLSASFSLLFAKVRSSSSISCFAVAFGVSAR